MIVNVLTDSFNVPKLHVVGRSAGLPIRALDAGALGGGTGAIVCLLTVQRLKFNAVSTE